MVKAKEIKILRKALDQLLLRPSTTTTDIVDDPLKSIADQIHKQQQQQQLLQTDTIAITNNNESPNDFIHHNNDTSHLQLHPILLDPKFRIVEPTATIISSPSPSAIANDTATATATDATTTTTTTKSSVSSIVMTGNLKQLSLMTPSSPTSTTTIQVQYYPSLAQESSIFRQCMTLFQHNMKELYTNSSWGYNQQDKEEELLHPNARFIVFTTNDNNSVTRSSSTTIDGDKDENNNVIAFIHYRYCYNDDDHPSCIVLYVYEIQVDVNYQKQHIGQYGMYLLEAIVQSINTRINSNDSKENNQVNGCSKGYTKSKTNTSTKRKTTTVSKATAKKTTAAIISNNQNDNQLKMIQYIMLTVFRNNTNAMNFYLQKLQYTIDACSPSQYHDTTADYEILSKSMLLLQQKQEGLNQTNE